jgi:hypothetical protein
METNCAVWVGRNGVQFGPINEIRRGLDDELVAWGGFEFENGAAGGQPSDQFERLLGGHLPSIAIVRDAGFVLEVGDICIAAATVCCLAKSPGIDAARLRVIWVWSNQSELFSESFTF